jgi:hypothetical protein
MADAGIIVKCPDTMYASKVVIAAKKDAATGEWTISASALIIGPSTRPCCLTCIACLCKMSCFMQLGMLVTSAKLIAAQRFCRETSVRRIKGRQLFGGGGIPGLALGAAAVAAAC